MNMEGGPYQEYFYIELPVGQVITSSSTTTNSQDADTSVKTAVAMKRRFVYVPTDQSTNATDGLYAKPCAAPIRFPMHLGLEVVHFNFTIISNFMLYSFVLCCAMLCCAMLCYRL